VFPKHTSKTQSSYWAEESIGNSTRIKPCIF